MVERNQREPVLQLFDGSSTGGPELVPRADWYRDIHSYVLTSIMLCVRREATKGV